MQILLHRLQVSVKLIKNNVKPAIWLVEIWIVKFNQQ